MSWQAVSYAVSVLDQESDMTMTDRLVLVLLAEHAHKDGSNARPSSGTIARRVGDLLQQRDTPVAAARHEPVMNRSMNQHAGPGDTVCIWCENTGWEYEDDNHVRQCRAGHRAS